jgi:hypothetical protein
MSVDLDGAFEQARHNAETYAIAHNAPLPTARCPQCGVEGHCPGLACPDCGYVHPRSWAILKSTEWGFDVVALNERRRVFGRFNVA